MENTYKKYKKFPRKIIFYAFIESIKYLSLNSHKYQIKLKNYFNSSQYLLKNQLQ